MQLRHCFTPTKYKSLPEKEEPLISSDILKEIAPQHLNLHPVKKYAGAFVLFICISCWTVC